MSLSFTRRIVISSVLLIGTMGALWLLSRNWPDSPQPKNPSKHVSPETNSPPASSGIVDDSAQQQQRARLLKAEKLLQKQLAQKNARSHEAILSFRDEEAYRKFLARAGAAGLKIVDQLNRLRTVRVRYESLDPLLNDVLGNPADYEKVDANFLVQIPGKPASDDRTKINPVPLGNSSLSFLGVTGDHRQWGRGITIAVLDTGVASDVTLSGGRVQYLDAGQGILPGAGPEDGHGTAVAGLIAGAAADAPGVAAAANILSIRVTDANGFSDSYTLAKGILTAVDAGARLINISMGAYASSAVLTSAIDYASARGAIIVAAAGNDGAAQLTWPAADPRVVSVGAVDALEQQVYFSNAGAQLKITAPGYGVDTAWLNGQRVSMDGTSASTPLVSGAIAAVMSTSPGLTATQAWSILQNYASDGGTPGPDANYGNGILNLGWAMNRADPTRVDTAIAGQYFDAATSLMNIVVQNRSAQAVSGLQLDVALSGTTTRNGIPPLSPGATYLVQAPINADQLAAAGGMDFRVRLNLPDTVSDQVPANNHKSGVILAPVK